MKYELNAGEQPAKKLGGQLFRKDIIHSGHYRHPVHGWELDVTPERMDKWVATFDRMRSNGVDIEVVVDHSNKADAVRGYVIGLERQGDTLYAKLQMNPDAADLPGRVKNVSVLLDHDMLDGENHRYGEAIRHVSFVQRPVVPHQKQAVPIAASLVSAEDESDEAFVQRRAAAVSWPPSTEEK